MTLFCFFCYSRMVVSFWWFLRGYLVGNFELVNPLKNIWWGWLTTYLFRCWSTEFWKKNNWSTFFVSFFTFLCVFVYLLKGFGWGFLPWLEIIQEISSFQHSFQVSRCACCYFTISKISLVMFLLTQVNYDKVIP